MGVLVSRSSQRWLLAAVPFALVAVLGVLRLWVGPGWGILPLLALGPALAALLGGVVLVLAVGAVSVVVDVAFLASDQFGSGAFHRAVTALVAIVGVTVGGALASAARTRRERDLARVRLVADVTQQVLLRPVPRKLGQVNLALRYESAEEEARVGGDLYDVAPTRKGLRLIIGDAKGKGLPALRLAAAVLGSFREAAYEEETLAAVVSRIETSLERQLGDSDDEEFVTAVIAEIPADGSQMELLSCGHPEPLLLRPPAARFIKSTRGNLPLGLGQFTCRPRTTTTICLQPGDEVLFYTDGLAEARNSHGEFFPLADSPALRSPHNLDTLLDRLSAEVDQYAGHAAHDDIALLLVSRSEKLLSWCRRAASVDRLTARPAPGCLASPSSPQAPRSWRVGAGSRPLLI